MSTGSGKQVEVKVRRAPKFGAFIVVGAGVAFIATLIVTSQFPADPNVGLPTLVAYFSLFTVPAGVVLGALIALLIDRRSSKRARTVSAEEETVSRPVAEPEPVVEPEQDELPEAPEGTAKPE